MQKMIYLKKLNPSFLFHINKIQQFINIFVSLVGYGSFKLMFSKSTIYMYSVIDKWIYGVKLSFEIIDIQTIPNGVNIFPLHIFTLWFCQSIYTSLFTYTYNRKSQKHQDTSHKSQKCLSLIWKVCNKSVTNKWIHLNELHFDCAAHFETATKQNRHSTVKPVLLSDNATNYRNVSRRRILCMCIQHSVILVLWSLFSHFARFVDLLRNVCPNNYYGCIYSTN